MQRALDDLKFDYKREKLFEITNNNEYNYCQINRHLSQIIKTNINKKVLIKIEITYSE